MNFQPDLLDNGEGVLNTSSDYTLMKIYRRDVSKATVFVAYAPPLRHGVGENRGGNSSQGVCYLITRVIRIVSFITPCDAVHRLQY